MIGILLLSDAVSSSAFIAHKSLIWPVLNHLPWQFLPHSVHSIYSLCVASYSLWIWTLADSQICEDWPSTEISVSLNSLFVYPIAKSTFCWVVAWICKSWTKLAVLSPSMYIFLFLSTKLPTFIILAGGATVNLCYIIFGSKQPCIALHFMEIMGLFFMCQPNSIIKFMFYP